ncbi:hypothetical protein EWM64_g280 [Hericium alpestre]|uniref:Major facilitator superfamily (MFS) profile domain-containing protein n=1 Tax=Hericium alpestre TaxID=135208 RepID=A0A4Z0AAH5_9AGAM|nr:hypothetical protein EWM64_g280 [Hericium alpestre]
MFPQLRIGTLSSYHRLALPTIVAQFGASQNEYTWVGVSYMLTQTACQPFYGRISDLVGRKNVLFASIFIFALGSLLCGTAQTILWLILARGLAGVGGGGIVSSVWVITSEIVEVHQRAKWSQALSITWSCSAIAGPLLGGVFSSSHSTLLNWRWAFYLNLPICLVATIVLAISLHGTALSRPQDATWRSFVERFDFLGLFLFIAASSCVIVGFSFVTLQGWTSPSTLSLVIIGVIAFVLAGFYEVNTRREALFPPAAFKDLAIIIILVVNFLHNFAFNAGTFYLALYYQPHELATGTSAFFLVRFTGATVGLSVAGAVYQSQLSETLETLSSTEFSHAVARSIQAIWTLCAPCLGFALLLSVFLRSFSVDGTAEQPSADVAIAGPRASSAEAQSKA